MPPDPALLWDGFSRDVAGMFDIVMADIPEALGAEGLRYMLRYLAAGIATCVEFDDAAYPELGTLIENRRSWGLDNPDTKYSFTRLEPGAEYRLVGHPGSALELEVQVDSGHFADGRFAEWNCLQRWRRGDGSLPLDDSGELTFTAPEDASYLHVREYFGDWETERPALLTVERLGAPLPPPRLGMEQMHARMELLGQWLTAGARCWAELGSGLASAEPGDIMPFVPPATATGLGGQAYGMGGFRCTDDEAVLLEFEPPPCRYWSVSLATWLWESPDISNTQCSLNHTQAPADADGTVRIALCQRDPGFANWLDPSGHEQGTIAFRLLDAEELPVLRYGPLRPGDLDGALGNSVRVSPGERQQRLGSRRDAVVRRYRR
ncbi:MAG: hypothetical protein ACR2OH_12885 [Microthrixaceae bacterium]